MRSAIRFFVFLSAFIFLHSFAACSGSSSRSPVDADGIQGNKPRYFYNHVSADRVLVISLNDTAKQATLYSIVSSVVSSAGAIAYESIRVTQDGKYLTIIGQNQIFEFNEAAPATVAQAGFVLPATSIDTLCFSSQGQGALLGSTGYSEVRSYIVTGGYSLVGIGASGPLPLLRSVATRNDTGVEVDYFSNGIGLHIQEHNPSAADSSYFQSFIDAAVSSVVDWASVNQMICHLNLAQSANVGSGGSQIMSIATGGYLNSCSVINGDAKCWGMNNTGQVGNNSTTNSDVSVQVQGLTSGVTAIAAGWRHACAIVNGGAMCWGDNSGALGNNSTTEFHVPVQVQGLTSGVTAITAGMGSSCAVVNGGAQCWGYNGNGQLGNNSTTDSLVPVHVQGLTSGVTALAAGSPSTIGFTCAIVNGGAMCWGGNSNGQLGNNSTTDSHVPVQVQGLTSGVTAIAIGDASACAIVNGGAQCWGVNTYGQLGNNSTTESHVPVQVQGLISGVTAIAIGFDSACAAINGAAKCWGAGVFGALGNNSTTESHVPVQVQGLTSGVTAISAGLDSACAIVNGAAQCWGWGGLGDGSGGQSSVPVLVQ